MNKTIYAKKRILDLIKEKPGITCLEIQVTLNTTHSTVYSVLRQLSNQAVIRKVKNHLEYPFTPKIRYYLAPSKE